MNKVKICFIQTNVYHLFCNSSNGIYGGSELQLYLIAKELSKDNKFLISFIVGDFGQKNIEEINNIILYKSCNPKFNGNLFIKFFQAIKYFRLLKKINADIYFTSTANSILGLVSFFCKMNRKKHIHRTAHQMDVDKSFIKNNSILGKIYRYGLVNSDVIFTQCNDHKELLKTNHNIDSIVIKNSFGIVNKKNKYKKFILWAARYEEWKQPGLFLKLARLFPNEKFIMVCNKNIDKIKDWEELREEAIEIKNLEFLEKVSINKIQNYFNKAKLFVNTSKFEGFPNTFIQAGIGKTPIISLNVNPDNFINKYICGYYCHNDFDLLIKFIDKLLNNETIYKKMSLNIFNYVNENHNIIRNIKEIKYTIFNLIKNK